jgi:hypothetical protein
VTAPPPDGFFIALAPAASVLGTTAAAPGFRQHVSGKKTAAGSDDVDFKGRTEGKSVVVSERKGQKDARVLRLLPCSLGSNSPGTAPKFPYDVSLKVNCVLILHIFFRMLIVLVVMRATGI